MSDEFLLCTPCKIIIVTLHTHLTYSTTCLYNLSCLHLVIVGLLLSSIEFLAKEITKNVRIFPSTLSLSKGKVFFEFLANYRTKNSVHMLINLTELLPFDLSFQVGHTFAAYKCLESVLKHCFV